MSIAIKEIENQIDDYVSCQSKIFELAGDS